MGWWPSVFLSFSLLGTFETTLSSQVVLIVNFVPLRFISRLVLSLFNETDICDGGSSLLYVVTHCWTCLLHFPVLKCISWVVFGSLFPS